MKVRKIDFFATSVIIFPKLAKENNRVNKRRTRRPGLSLYCVQIKFPSSLNVKRKLSKNAITKYKKANSANIGILKIFMNPDMEYLVSFILSVLSWCLYLLRISENKGKCYD